MNVLLIRRPFEAMTFADGIRLAGMRPGIHVEEFEENPDIAAFNYKLRNLKWTPEPAPNAIIYPLTSLYLPQEQWPAASLALNAVVRTASRDNCTLFLLIPPIQSAEQEDFVRKQEGWIFESTASAFVLHGAAIDTDDRLPGLIIRMSDSGMFGRYRPVSTPAKNLTVKPMLLKEPLWAPVRV